ncbi:hypothetical protein M501DRAFT_1034801 [Patellaria atrata CBS 101060]|uniref:Uncharacterized protein n=1 Tax=Patellaria atrata CBS 101060 TaxID=1346257 RepID=A0A9P4VP82_9PEZI|nr:hypothetical protein M501DRAFT_1034801 [Patellaria atrata CBS 101060]
MFSYANCLAIYFTTMFLTPIVSATLSPKTGLASYQLMHVLVLDMSYVTYQIYYTILAGRHDPRKERPQPPKATPVTFPQLSYNQLPNSWSTESLPDLASKYAKIRKQSDLKLEHLTDLNVTVEPSCDLEDLLSTLPDGLSYMPPGSWLEEPAADSGQHPGRSEEPKRLLHNGRPVPDHREFYMRFKEICLQNQEAFSSLTRMPERDRKPPRLAYFRRFWEGLDNMAYYWDTSLDKYIDPRPIDRTDTEDVQSLSELSNEAGPVNNRTQVPEERLREIIAMRLDEPRKKAKSCSDLSIIEPDPALSSPENKPTNPVSSSSKIQGRPHPPRVPGSKSGEKKGEKETSDKPDTQGTYCGNRVGNGAGMPEAYRYNAVSSFVETIAWAFSLSVAPHRRPPVVAFKNVLMPVRISTVVWQPPLTRDRAKMGVINGPVLGVQCRNETAFKQGSAGEAEALLDIIRELGALLELGQERAREGKEERKPGEGEWWTTKPRWGGGPGGDLGEGRGEEEAEDGKVSEKKEKKFGRRERLKPSPLELWKAMKPSSGYWDPRVTYQAIGKNEASEFDDVFLISSLNHHSLVRSALLGGPHSFNARAMVLILVLDSASRKRRCINGKYRIIEMIDMVLPEKEALRLPYCLLAKIPELGSRR